MRSPGKTHSLRKQVFLVENHPVTSDGFTHLLNAQADLQVCGHAATSAGALSSLEKLRPDLVILEISLADSSGLDLIKQLKTRFPKLLTLVLSSQDESLYAERALRAGAKGYVMKHTPTPAVINAIRVVLKGGIYLSEPMRDRLVLERLHGPGVGRATGIAALSDRELEIFELLGNGRTTRRIAEKLHVSVSTVETHRAHIKQKLNLSNAVELVRRAVAWVNRR